MKQSPPKQVINEGKERCAAAQVFRQSSANFQFDVSPGASGPYGTLGPGWGKPSITVTLKKKYGTGGGMSFLQITRR